ncbi:MAG: TetR family transcriptional regulator [Candidatus Dormibacteraeota bacterium]|nr:TetR family transcriptional regulator [Candidatus Dormibacteraeota bacterium]
MTSAEPYPRLPPGLRERKKARTRIAIQRQAIRLFLDQGYEGTTVEQIAAAAEVSPSTFFRYFQTKEDVVIRDDYDRLMLDAFRAQPRDLTPVQAARAAIHQLAAVLGELSPDDLALEQERAILQFSVPEIRARFIDEVLRAFWLFAEAVAERVESLPEALPVRTFTGALLGALMGAYLPVADEGQGGAREIVALALSDQRMQQIDQALALLEAGLPL